MGLREDVASLQKRVEELELETARIANPFEDPTIQLALENGHTVSARIRRMQMTCTQFPDSTDARMRFTDGSTLTATFGVRVPSDWVEGTALTVNIYLFSSSTGNMNFNSAITAHLDGETQSLGNIENVTGQIQGLAGGDIRLLSRDVTGSLIVPSDALQWKLQRQGGAGNDSVDDDVDALYGAYLEYTGFF